MMNKVYRFIGAESNIGSIKMTRFGQRFEMNEEVAKNAQKGGTALLEAEVFDSIGFTDNELKVWADPFMSDFDVPANKQDAAAKAAFLGKKEEALEEYRAIQHDLLDPHDRVNRVTATEVAAAEVDEVKEVIEQ